MGLVSRSLRFHILYFMLEGETLPVGRKIKVAICSLEVDHLFSSEGCVGLFVKIYFQSLQATCVCGRQGVCLS